MRLFNLKWHSVLDYLLAVGMITSPWLYNFTEFGLAQNIPMVLGICLLVYSVFTEYGLCIIPLINIKVNLGLDIVSGAFLAVSPWLFEFNEYVFMPHLIYGLGQIGIAVLTDAQPDTSNRSTLVAS